MPTVSRETGSPEPEAHRFRQVAESFGIDAERYDRARPSYPDALISRILATAPGADALGGGDGRRSAAGTSVHDGPLGGRDDSENTTGRPGPDVLDVGCGTGIAARQFRAAGCRVLGVEPDARMAEFARRDGLAVEVATFEEWDQAGREFDVVVAGQAWHWVDPVAGPAKAARVLRPGGRVAVFAHAFEPPAEVYEPFAAALRRVLPDAPVPVPDSRPEPGEIYGRMFDGFATGIRRSGRFTQPEHRHFDWEHRYTRESYLDLLPTQGLLTRVPPGPRAEILADVGAAIDALGGTFTMHFTTHAVTATRRPGGHPS